MLTFVGLGLYDEKDITLKGLEAVRTADKVYAEFYTSPLGGRTVEKMQRVYGRRISVLERSDLEENAEAAESGGILELAKRKNVVLLCGGDSMVATTHVDLRLRAIDREIKTRLIHAPSILSAVAGLCGLQNYKFGKSATVSPPYPHGCGGVISEVPYDTLKTNKERGLHTLLFLDISMSVKEALGLLETVEERRRGTVLKNKKSIIVGIARAGSEEPVVKADYLEGLKSYDFGELPHVLVVPGELHFLEKEALVKIANFPAP